jgi:hypothetical protein
MDRKVEEAEASPQPQDSCCSKGHSTSESSQADFEEQITLSDTGKTLKDDQWLDILDEHFASAMDFGLTTTLGKPLIAEAIVSECPSRILETNSAFLTTLGFKLVEVLQTLRIIKGPETDDSKLTRLIQRAIEDSSSDVSIVLYRKDGEDITCVVRGEPIMYDSQPACRLRILPYSFESQDVNGSASFVGECNIQCQRSLSVQPLTTAAPRNTMALEHFKICGGSASFRELLGFRPDDSVQVCHTNRFSTSCKSKS